MAILVYRDKSEREHEVSITRDFPEVTIGRHTDSIIKTSNASVSRRHALVRLVPEGYEIADQGSSSGTYINNQKVTRQLLRDGDEIYCGSFLIKFTDDPPVVPDIAQLVYHDDNGVERAVQMGADAPRIAVGRNPECAIRTADTSVSRLHSEFLYSQGRYEVVDLESFNSTYVNGQKVSRHPLNHNDEIRCGRITIIFYAQPARGPRQEYSSSHIPVEPSQSGMVNTVRAPSVDEFNPTSTASAGPTHYRVGEEVVNQLRAEADALKGQLEALRADLTATRSHSDALRREVDDSRRQSDADRARVIDLEKEVKRKQVSLDAIQEMYGQLKEQSDQQLTQLDRNREELSNRQAEYEHAQYKLDSMQAQHDQGHNQVARYIEENAELKAQINRLQRTSDEADKSANLYEYELKEARGELERLRSMVAGEEAEAANFEKDVAELRLIVESKEADLVDRERDIERLRGELEEFRNAVGRDDGDRERERLLGELDYARSVIEDLERKVAKVEAELAQKGESNDSPSMLELKVEKRKLQQQLKELKEGGATSRKADARERAQVNDLKRTNRDQRNRISELEAALEAGGGSVGGGEAERELKQRNRELEDRLAGMEDKLASRGDGGGDDAELRRAQRDVRRLEGEVEGLQSELDRAKSGGGGSGQSQQLDRVRDGARQVYGALNDNVSQLKNDTRLIQDFLSDLRKVYDSYRRVDLAEVSTLDRVRIERTLREMDPDTTFEELEHTVGVTVETTEGMKRSLREFRDKALDD
jgi:pSer/pThr/pTyr-binding forkhead associated (FHA) protein/DNA repair exonuclease SbcCD ATPase subunit